MSNHKARPSKLKPCPFCGNEIFTVDCVKCIMVVNSEESFLTCIECPKCKTQGPPSDEWAGEAIAWNKRTNP